MTTDQKSDENRINSWLKVQKFIESHPEDKSASNAFARWHDVVKRISLTNFHEIKRSFSTASLVDELVVFNIGGGKYRLVASINYIRKIILIRRVMTHIKYDEWCRRK